jgi:hypothetical protein
MQELRDLMKLLTSNMLVLVRFTRLVAIMNAHLTLQVHLMELPNPDPTTGRPEHGGRDRHAAISIRNLAPLKARLDANVYTPQ